jgi:hypothetical protein
MKPLAEVHTESEIEYTNCFWGEIVNGTKAQLQSLGLGVNKPFPGEPNGPKRSMRLIDPRGLSAKILKWYDGKYAACIKYHGRSIPETEQWVEYASGVRLLRSCWDDKYVGSARALETVGIVMAAQVPGQPGMRKLKVTIYADGSIPKSPTGTNNRLAHAAGAKIIERHSNLHVESHISTAWESLGRTKCGA